MGPAADIQGDQETGMKYSYTYTCPKGHPFVSYAPSEGETVTCDHRTKLGEDEWSGPCGAEMQKMEKGAG